MPTSLLQKDFREALLVRKKAKCSPIQPQHTPVLKFSVQCLAGRAIRTTVRMSHERTKNDHFRTIGLFLEVYRHFQDQAAALARTAGAEVQPAFTNHTAFMLSLPAELYIFILKHLDYKSLLKCMQVGGCWPFRFIPSSFTFSNRFVLYFEN